MLCLEELFSPKRKRRRKAVPLVSTCTGVTPTSTLFTGTVTAAMATVLSALVTTATDMADGTMAKGISAAVNVVVTVARAVTIEAIDMLGNSVERQLCADCPRRQEYYLVGSCPRCGVAALMMHIKTRAVFCKQCGEHLVIPVTAPMNCAEYV